MDFSYLLDLAKKNDEYAKEAVAIIIYFALIIIFWGSMMFS